MKDFKENFGKIIFKLSATVSIVAVALICLFLFVNGIPAIIKIGIFDFLTGTKWAPSNEPAVYGILPMILGSIYITTGAVLLGTPIGILSAIYLSKYCSDKAYKKIKPIIELLAGIPSVVYGFFGIIVIVPFVSNVFGGNGYSILTASILLAIMILPTVITICENSLNCVPNSYYEGALALGASHERSVFKVVVPSAKSGILTAIVLAIGRAVGETMAVVMVSGNQARMPKGIFKGIRTMTSNIVLEMGYATDLHKDALIATGVILFVFILTLNLFLSLLIKKEDF